MILSQMSVNTFEPSLHRHGNATQPFALSWKDKIVLTTHLTISSSLNILHTPLPPTHCCQKYTVSCGCLVLAVSEGRRAEGHFY